MQCVRGIRVRFLAVLGLPASQLERAGVLAARGEHGAAFRWYARAAQAGLAAARFGLGHAYLLGLGVPSSIADALVWLRRAAEAGDTAAQVLLCNLALQGISRQEHCGFFDTASREVGEPDFDLALRWARLAAASGSADARAPPVHGRSASAG